MMICVSLKSCDTYQRINDTKFSNIDAALLHPIPAEYKGRIAITLLHNVMKVSGVGRESVMYNGGIPRA